MMEEQPQPPKFIPPVPPPGIAGGTSPARPGGSPLGAGGKEAPSSGMEFLHRRLESMERDLLWERERTREAENKIKQQEALRSEVDKQLKEILEQLRREKAEREQGEEKSHARGRIDALENRLDEMHKTWAELLKEAMAQREAPKTSSGQPSSGVASEDQSLQASRSVEQIRDLITRMSAGIEDRIGALMRERAGLQEALEESRHQIRQEYIKERAALQAQWNQEFQDIRQSLSAISKNFQGATQEDIVLKNLISKLNDTLNRPAGAKDQIVLDLEREKRDLMQALSDRTDQLRRYTLERRDVERSMGEALMNLNRQLETEQSKYQQLNSHIGDLELQIKSLHSQLEQAKQSDQNEDKRLTTLAQERDELVKALMAEAQKVQNQISMRMESDKAWEERFNQLHALLDDEKNKRLQADSQLSDLRAQTQTLSEHIARTLQEKDKVESQSSTWKKEREDLLATLRKKEEVIAMLSATFQNMMKK